MRKNLRIPFAIYTVLLCVLTFAFAQESVAQQLIYVSESATGTNDGSSWQNAYTQLQPAINAASSTDQIWVAGGTYYPTQQRTGGVNRSRSFMIPDDKNGLRIFGGFAGTETQLSQRLNPQENISRLSGDVDQNDKPQNIYEDSDRTMQLNPNSLPATDHIVVSVQRLSSEMSRILDDTNVFSVMSMGNGIGRETILDGFTVSGGFAVTLPLENFEHNMNFYSGGGLNCNGCSATIQNVRFEGNYSMYGGGAVSVYNNGSPLFVNSVFYGNAAGGYVPSHVYDRFIDTSQLILKYTYFNSPATDSFDGEGGAIYSANGSSPEIINSTMYGNMNNRSSKGSHIQADGQISLRNSIVWGGGNYITGGSWASGKVIAGHGFVQNSVLQDGCPANVACGLISTANPQLNDDLKITSAGSPAVGRGNNDFLPEDTGDLNENGNTTEPIPYDAAGNPRTQEGFTDAGAFESPFSVSLTKSQLATSTGQKVQISAIRVNELTGAFINNIPITDFTVESDEVVSLIMPEGASTGKITATTPDYDIVSNQELVITDGNGGGKALVANGNGYVQTPDASVFNTRHFSVSFWIRITAPSAFSGDIISKGTGSNKRWSLSKRPSSTSQDLLIFQTTMEDGSTGSVRNGTSTNLATGRWQHVTITYKNRLNYSTPSTARIYIDGVSRSNSFSSYMVDSDAPILIGNGNGYEIDNVMYWNRELSDQEVNNFHLKHINLTPFNPESNGLVASYRFDSDNSTTVYDYAGRNNGTLVSGAGRTEYSGLAVATEISNPAGTSGASITVGQQDYKAYMIGNPAGELIPKTQPGEAYSFQVPEDLIGRSPVSWMILSTSQLSKESVSIDFSGVESLDGSLKVIYRPNVGEPWSMAAGNWVIDQEQDTYTLSNASQLPTGEYSIIDVQDVLLAASVSPRAQWAKSGEEVRFTLELHNSGVDDLNAPSTFELNFQGLENVSFSGGQVNGTTWNIPEIAAKATIALEVTATKSNNSQEVWLEYTAANTTFQVFNSNLRAYVFDPVYETGQNITLSGSGNHFLEVQNSPNVLGLMQSSFTVEGWVYYPVTNSLLQPLVSQDDESINALRIGVDRGRPMMEFNGSRIMTGAEVSQGNWHHLAFSYNMSSGDRIIYLDGQLVASDVTGAGPIFLNSPLTIARWRWEDNRQLWNMFTGQIHNLRFWKTSLTRMEILERMHQHVPDSDPLSDSLTADFQFTEGKGAQAYDYAGGQLLTSPVNLDWNNRSRVLFGSQSAVATEDTPATVGQPGASLTASDVSTHEVLIHKSGSPENSDRTADEAAESYDADLETLVTERPDVTWSVFRTRGATPEVLLELSYGSLSLENEEPERLFVIHRDGPDKDWSIDPNWTNHPDSKTFSRSGSVKTGEYSIVTITTVNLTVEFELISYGTPQENSFELKVSTQNTGMFASTQTVVNFVVDRPAGIENITSTDTAFDSENLVWTIGEVPAGETKSLTLTGTIPDTKATSIHAEIVDNTVINLAPEEQRSDRIILAKTPYGSGSALLLDRELSTDGNGNELGLVNKSFTVEAWINPSAISGDQTILGQTNAGESRTIHLILRDGKVHMGFFGDDLQGQTDVPANTWSHVAFTYDVETNARVVYLNGIADGTDTAVGPFLGDGNVYIGRWGDGNYLNGRMDELRIWNGVRSQEEIKSNMHRTISMIEPDFQNLNAYYRFDESEGNIAHDIRNGFKATFAGASTWEPSEVRMGQLANTVEPGSSDGVNNEGSRLEITDLTGSTVLLYSYGNLNGELRTTENSNDVFEDLESAGIESRSAKIWAVQISDDQPTEATIKIDYSDLGSESSLFQSAGLIYRPNKLAPWQLVPADLWIKNTTQQEFIYTGPVSSGEYGLAAYPYLSAAYDGETAGWRMIGAPASSARYDDILSKAWTQGFSGAIHGEDSEPNVFFYDEASREWIVPNSITNIFGTNSDQGISSSGKAALVYFFDNQQPYEVQYSGISNSQEVVLELEATVLDSDDGNQGWHMISNPYPFAIDWTKVVADGLDDIAPPIFIYDPNTFTGYGGYRVHYGYNIPSLPGDIRHDGILPPFQAFFIRTAQIDGTGGTLTFKPSHKATSDDGVLYNIDSEIAEEADHKYLLLSVRNTESTHLSSSLLSITNDVKNESLELGRPAALVKEEMVFGIHGSSSSILSQKTMKMEVGQEYNIPVSFDARQSGNYEFSIPSIDTWKYGPVTLTDHKTGKTMLMDESTVYSFEHKTEATMFSQEVSSDSVSVSPLSSFSTNHEAESISEDAPRFTVTVAYSEYTDEANIEIPQELVLRQNYPNPFNPTTTITYGLPEITRIRLEVFNVLGQRVATLVDGEQAAGYHNIQFNGNQLSSGVYIYRLQTDHQVFVQKMILVK